MSDASPDHTSETDPEIAQETAASTAASTAVDPAVEPAVEAPGKAPADAKDVSSEEAASADPAVATAPASEPRPVFVAAKLVMLIEPDSPVRGSVLTMSRTLAHVDVRPFSSVELGEEFMKDYRIQALLLSVSEGSEPMDFLARLRRGECPCDADIPVVVMASTCDATLAGQLKEYGVSRLLIEPFKLGDMAHTLEQLWEVEVTIPPQKPAPDPVAEATEAPESAEGDGEKPAGGEAAAPAAEAPAEEKPVEDPAGSEPVQPETA